MAAKKAAAAASITATATEETCQSISLTKEYTVLSGDLHRHAYIVAGHEPARVAPYVISQTILTGICFFRKESLMWFRGRLKRLRNVDPNATCASPLRNTIAKFQGALLRRSEEIRPPMRFSRHHSHLNPLDYFSSQWKSIQSEAA